MAIKRRHNGIYNLHALVFSLHLPSCPIIYHNLFRKAKVKNKKKN